MAAHRANMAGLMLDAASRRLVQEGIPIKVIWVLDISQGRRRAGGPLRGGRAGGPARPQGGVEQTAVGATMLNAALAKAGLRTTDITVSARATGRTPDGLARKPGGRS